MFHDFSLKVVNWVDFLSSFLPEGSGLPRRDISTDGFWDDEEEGRLPSLSESGRV